MISRWSGTKGDKQIPFMRFAHNFNQKKETALTANSCGHQLLPLTVKMCDDDDDDDEVSELS